MCGYSWSEWRFGCLGNLIMWAVLAAVVILLMRLYRRHRPITEHKRQATFEDREYARRIQRILEHKTRKKTTPEEEARSDLFYREKRERQGEHGRLAPMVFRVCADMAAELFPQAHGTGLVGPFHIRTVLPKHWRELRHEFLGEWWFSAICPLDTPVVAKIPVWSGSYTRLPGGGSIPVAGQRKVKVWHEQRTYVIDLAREEGNEWHWVVLGSAGAMAGEDTSEDTLRRLLRQSHPRQIPARWPSYTVDTSLRRVRAGTAVILEDDYRTMHG